MNTTDDMYYEAPVKYQARTCALPRPVPLSTPSYTTLAVRWLRSNLISRTATATAILVGWGATAIVYTIVAW